MPKPEQAPEPSIEEILASIRRIIADDAPAAAVNEDVFDQQPAMQAAPARAKPSGPSAPRLVEDEVLELTEDFMLAEEAPAMTLQEPAEPGEFSGAQQYDAGGDHYDARGEQYESRGEPSSYRDPYDESFARRTAGPAASADASKGERSAEAEGMFSAVMAEVQRFATEGGQREEPEESTSSGEDNWGQPDLEALTPQPSARTSSRPVWSARRTEGDAGRAPAEAAPSRPAAPPETKTERKPNPAGNDSWSRGVQMPVPDAGPAIPFPAEETPAPRSKASAPAAAPQPAQRPAPEFPVNPRFSEEPAAPAPAEAKNAAPKNVVQDRAEELAGKAVSDFTTDRLSAPPVVADILKGDKPLMDAITTSLANALSRGGSEEPDDFEEAPHPEDFADDIFAPGKPSVAAPESASPSQSKPERPAMPDIVNLDGGFVAQRPVATKAAEPAPADPEMPELPREDIDDIVPDTQASTAESPAYRPTGIAEPLMPNVPAAPGRGASRSVAGLAAAREPVVASAERLQPASGPKSLEETIKEMLKPLLLQWLDENMPRIVNEAIREEIAANGLLPRAREARR